jgi:hypothetical protein
MSTLDLAADLLSASSNLSFAAYSTYQDTRDTVRNSKENFSSIGMAGKTIMQLKGDHGNMLGDLTSYSGVLPNTAAATLFVSVAGPLGASLCCVGDVLTLKGRISELNEVNEKLKAAEKDKQSLTYQLLLAKKHRLVKLCASSVVAVIADGAVIAGSVATPAAFGAGLGALAVSGARTVAEDHINQSFLKQLTEYADRFEHAHYNDVHNRGQFQANRASVKSRYEQAKAEQQAAENLWRQTAEDLETVKEEIELYSENLSGHSLMGQAIKDRQDWMEFLTNALEDSQNACNKAAEKTKKLEKMHKGYEARHQDLESYDACREMVQEMDALIREKNHLASQVKAFEQAYAKTHGKEIEPYKLRNFGKVNPEWEKSLEASLKKQLEDADKEHSQAVKTLKDERASLEAHVKTLKGCSNCGDPAKEKEWRETQDKLSVNRAKLTTLDEEYHAKYQAIKNQRPAIEKYKENRKKLDKVSEKIVLRNRRFEQEKTLRQIDNVPQGPIENLLNTRNLETYRKYLAEKDKAQSQSSTTGTPHLVAGTNVTDTDTDSSHSLQDKEFSTTHVVRNTSDDTTTVVYETPSPKVEHHHFEDQRPGKIDVVALPVSPPELQRPVSTVTATGKTETPVSPDFTSTSSTTPYDLLHRVVSAPAFKEEHHKKREPMTGKTTPKNEHHKKKVDLPSGEKISSDDFRTVLVNKKSPVVV